MRNGVSAIPKGMQAREFIGEVCVPALINAASANSIRSVAFIRDLIDETLEEVFPTDTEARGTMDDCREEHGI